MIPHLLQHGDALRLIDEMYIECHHVETWGHRGHTYKECLELYRDFCADGLFVHEWF